MAEIISRDWDKDIESSGSERSMRSSMYSLRLQDVPLKESYTGTFTFNSSSVRKPNDSKMAEFKVDPWDLYKEKLDREIALDSERLTRLRETAQSMKSPKSSNPSMTCREYNSDLIPDLEDEEEKSSPQDQSLTHKRKAEISEMPLETARFQDLSEIPERPKVPKPMIQTDFGHIETPEPKAETPRQPGEPIVNRLQRTFKVTHRVPKELLADQTVDNLRHIIEILISDKLNLQEQLSSVEPQEKKTPNSSLGEEDMRPSIQSPTPNYSFTTTQSNSVMKQRMFPVRGLGNQEELMMRRTNNQSTYQKPPTRERESIPAEIDEVSLIATPEAEPKPLSKNMKTFDNYEADLVRLHNEVEELKTKNALLTQVLRLSPDKRRVAELTNQMQARLQQQFAIVRNLMDENAALKARIQVVGITERQSSCTPSRAASPAGSALQGASQFFNTYETEGSQRRISPKPLLGLKELVPDEDNVALKPEEKRILQSLIEMHATGDEKRFEEYVYALLSKHDSGEFASVLIRHIRYLEEDIFYTLRKQVLELRTKSILQDTCYQEILNEKAKLDVEAKELRNSIEEMRMELDRVNNRVQVELRRSKAEIALTASKSSGKMMAKTKIQKETKPGKIDPMSWYVCTISNGEKEGKVKEPYKVMTRKANFSPWATTTPKMP